MKILLYSDIHTSDLKLYDDHFDLVVTLGDVHWEDLKKIDAHYKCKKIGVLGNHDRNDYFIGTDIENLHGKTIEHMGYVIAGFEGCPRYNQKQNSPQYYEDEMEQVIYALDRKADIVIAHSNVSDHVSDDLSYAHRGFHCIEQYLLKNNVKYFFHGHEHKPRTYDLKKTICHCVFGDLILDIRQ